MRYALAAYALAFLAACIPPHRDTGVVGVCGPRVTIPIGTDPEPVATYYDEALITLAEMGYETPDMCGVHMLVQPFDSIVELRAACDNSEALACVNTRLSHGIYWVRFMARAPEHLRHEYLHVLLSEIGVPVERHHRILNRRNVYYYPTGQNLDSE